MIITFCNSSWLFFFLQPAPPLPTFLPCRARGGQAAAEPGVPEPAAFVGSVLSSSSSSSSFFFSSSSSFCSSRVPAGRAPPQTRVGFHARAVPAPRPPPNNCCRCTKASVCVELGAAACLQSPYFSSQKCGEKEISSPNRQRGGCRATRLGRDQKLSLSAGIREINPRHKNGVQLAPSPRGRSEEALGGPLGEEILQGALWGQGPSCSLPRLTWIPAGCARGDGSSTQAGEKWKCHQACRKGKWKGRKRFEVWEGVWRWIRLV